MDKLNTINSNKSVNDSKDLCIPVGIYNDDCELLNLNKNPHILISGTVSTGKTTLVHSMLNSIIMNYKPSEIRLVI